MSLTAAAVLLFVIGMTLMLAGWFRREQQAYVRDDGIVVPGKPGGLSVSVERRLRAAGVTEISGSLFVSGTLVGMGLLGTISAIMLSSPVIGLLIGGIVPPVVVWMYLNNRERSFLKRASAELVSFLRRIEMNVRAGQSVQLAFQDALRESKAIRSALEDSLVQMQLQVPFDQVLRESTDKLPLRQWKQFVRQLEMQQRSGGDLATTLAETVELINGLIQLQEELRTKASGFDKQRKAILGLGIAFVFMSYFVMDKIILELFENGVAGYLIAAAGIGLMSIGWLVGQVQTRDVERKINF